MPSKADLITLQRILPPPFHPALRGAPAVAETQTDRWIFERLYLLGATARGDGFEPIDARQKLGHLAEIAQAAPSDALAWGRARAIAISELHPADSAGDTQYMTYMRLWRAVCVDLSESCLRVGNAIADAIPDASFEPDTDHGGDEELRWSGVVKLGNTAMLYVDATLLDAHCNDDGAEYNGCGLSITTHTCDGHPLACWIPYGSTEEKWVDSADELRRRLTYELPVETFARAVADDCLDMRRPHPQSQTHPVL